jgi:hypothetical protein
MFAIESQISKEHKLKLGIESRFHEIVNHSKSMRNLTEGQLDSLGNSIFTPGYSEQGTAAHVYYLRRPFEFAGYIQDKMEYDIMIINAGVRFDYFNQIQLYQLI